MAMERLLHNLEGLERLCQHQDRSSQATGVSLEESTAAAVNRCPPGVNSKELGSAPEAMHSQQVLNPTKSGVEGAARAEPPGYMKTTGKALASAHEGAARVAHRRLASPNRKPWVLANWPNSEPQPSQGNGASPAAISAYKVSATGFTML